MKLQLWHVQESGKIAYCVIVDQPKRASSREKNNSLNSISRKCHLWENGTKCNGTVVRLDSHIEGFGLVYDAAVVGCFWLLLDSWIEAFS